LNDDPEVLARRDREIDETVLAAWRAFNDLRLVDKSVALEQLELRLQIELAGHERAMVERLH
jgi:hypothetical protein